MTLLPKKTLTLALVTIITSALFGQTSDPALSKKRLNQAAAHNIDDTTKKVVVVTGARFSYKLVERWIDEYNKSNPEIQIIIQSRGIEDPLKYEILAEVFEHSDEVKKNREYVNVGRYAVLPVANSHSLFAKAYSDKGLNADLINQIFFYDTFSEKAKQQIIQGPFTVYTRLQEAGVPKVFSTFYGHTQKDLKGIAIAGSDAHLLTALLLDSTGVTYLPLPLIYDEQTRKPVEGVTVLPVDLNGNKKVSDEEKFYDHLDAVIEKLETQEAGKIKNIPVAYLHLSVDRQHASAEAMEFLKWVKENGQNQLHHYGYLRPDDDLK